MKQSIPLSPQERKFKRHSPKIIFITLMCLSINALAQAEKNIPWQNNEISVGFFNDKFLNYTLPTPPPPLFWTATNVNSGAIISYQHLMYHTAEHFSFYLGLSSEYWVLNSQVIYGVSALITFRFWALRTAIASPYLIYSIASPTLLSRSHIDGVNLGSAFIFQDKLGLGVELGAKHPVTLELGVIHYSNGDVFPTNSGLQVPFVLSIGYGF